MKKSALIFVVVAALDLLCGTAISNAQDRERLHAAVPQMEGARRGEGPTKGDGDRAHLHRPAVIVVAVPIFVGPAYGSYYQPPPIDAYRTLDGFYYYCVEFADYYPALQDCPNGWRLVP
jgi:hypothetical protein